MTNDCIWSNWPNPGHSYWRSHLTLQWSRLAPAKPAFLAGFARQTSIETYLQIHRFPLSRDFMAPTILRAFIPNTPVASMLQHTMLHHTMLHHDMLHHIMLHHTMLHHTMLHHTMLHHTMLQYYTRRLYITLHKSLLHWRAVWLQEH